VGRGEGEGGRFRAKPVAARIAVRSWNDTRRLQTGAISCAQMEDQWEGSGGAWVAPNEYLFVPLGDSKV